jgi:hypothetical protein
LGINIPAAFTSAPYNHTAAENLHWWNLWQLFAHGWTSTGAVLNVPAMLIIAVVTALLVVGIKESANVNNLIVALKLLVILTFIGVGAAYINHANWHPFVPPAARRRRIRLERRGARGRRDFLRLHRIRRRVHRRAGSEESATRHAHRAARFARCLHRPLHRRLTRADRRGELHSSSTSPRPIALAISTLGPSLAWLTYFIKIGAIAGLSSVILVMLLGQPRIFYTMAKDGLLPPVFGAVHPKFRRRGSRKSSPASPPCSLPDCFPSACSANSFLSARCWRSRLSASEFSCCVSPTRICTRPFRTPAFWLVAPLGVSLVRLPDDRFAAGHLGAAHRVDCHWHRDLLRLRLPPVEVAGLIFCGQLSFDKLCANTYRSVGLC